MVEEFRIKIVLMRPVKQIIDEGYGKYFPELLNPENSWMKYHTSFDLEPYTNDKVKTNKIIAEWADNNISGRYWFNPAHTIRMAGICYEQEEDWILTRLIL